MVAVLPELLRRSRVLEQDPINVEGANLSAAVAIDSLTNTGNQPAQFGFVVRDKFLNRWPRSAGVEIILAEHEQ